MDELIKISKNENGIVTVSSKQVAENFGKEHTKVIRAIEDILMGIDKIGDTLFIESKYQNEQNKQWYKYYECWIKHGLII